MDIQELKQEIEQNQKIYKPSDWRYGQFVFNYIEHRYKVARKCQFEYGIDCFYDDKLVDDFLNKCVELINEDQDFSICCF